MTGAHKKCEISVHATSLNTWPSTPDTVKVCSQAELKKVLADTDYKVQK